MPSVRKSYDEELLQLDTLLARMGHEAGVAIESALTALRNDDIELARSVVARDSQIDASEHEIEHRCLQLLLRQQPVASDLRKVSTALKMVTDVERIGDQASDIAELVLHLHAKSTDAVGVLEDILKMGDDVLKMVKRSIAAYVQVDLAAAAEAGERGQRGALSHVNRNSLIFHIVMPISQPGPHESVKKICSPPLDDIEGCFISFA